MTAATQKTVFLFILISQFVLISTVRAEDQPRQIESLVYNCYTCHGPEGKSPGEIPSLNNLSEQEIKAKLLDYRRDINDPTIMNRIAKGYDEYEIERIAQFLVNQQ